MQLPFYEAVGVTGEYNVTQDPQKCRWEQKVQKGLTVQSVTGKGLCLGQVKDRNFLCNQSQPIDQEGYFLPPDNSWWACSKLGLTLCFSGKVANESKEYWFRYFPKSCITQKMKYTIN